MVSGELSRIETLILLKYNENAQSSAGFPALKLLEVLLMCLAIPGIYHSPLDSPTPYSLPHHHRVYIRQACTDVYRHVYRVTSRHSTNQICSRPAEDGLTAYVRRFSANTNTEHSTSNNERRKEGSVRTYVQFGQHKGTGTHLYIDNSQPAFSSVSQDPILLGFKGFKGQSRHSTHINLLSAGEDALRRYDATFRDFLRNIDTGTFEPPTVERCRMTDSE